MPTYEFRCKNGHVTEVRTAFKMADEDGSVHCRICNKRAFRVIVPSSPPIVIGDTCVKVSNQIAVRD